MHRSNVVLPEPDRPMTMTASRWRTSRSTPRSTWLEPKYFSSAIHPHDRLAECDGRSSV